jgi:hypothetical protein
MLSSLWYIFVNGMGNGGSCSWSGGKFLRGQKVLLAWLFRLFWVFVWFPGNGDAKFRLDTEEVGIKGLKL